MLEGYCVNRTDTLFSFKGIFLYFRLGIVGSLSSGKSALVHRYLTGSYMQVIHILNIYIHEVVISALVHRYLIGSYMQVIHILNIYIHKVVISALLHRYLTGSYMQVIYISNIYIHKVVISVSLYFCKSDHNSGTYMP